MPTQTELNAPPLTLEKDNWKQIAADDYDDAAYNNPLFYAIYSREMDYMADRLTKDCVLLEVGCGTCKFCMSFHGNVAHIVGVDISQESLDYVRHRFPAAKGELVLINGDATQLESVLRNASDLPPDFWGRKRVVCCTMNTLGSMPKSTRQTVINEMVKVAGDDGVLFLTVFNGEHFASGVEKFYKTVPRSCGTIQDTDISFETTEINVPSTGYYAHWFMPDEVAKMLDAAGLRDYQIEQHGVGLFVTSPATRRLDLVGRQSDQGGVSGVVEPAISTASKSVLHVGCGTKRREKLHRTFHSDEWHEIRLDIDPSVKPDVIASITHMPQISGNSVDAVWSSHNLEHLYSHEVPIALREFLRVLKPGGFALLTMPDLQKAAEYLARGQMEETVYQSPAGPIAAIDICFGHRASVARGNEFMAHKTGFSAGSLTKKLTDSGFQKVRVERRGMDLWAIAYKPTM